MVLDLSKIVFGDGGEDDGLSVEFDEDGAIHLLRFLSASKFALDRPHWAWDRRIPIAGVTLLAGRQGQGKTAFIGHLAARWTQGQMDGEFHGTPAHVVYIGVEDDQSTVLVPRLTAAGADLDRIHFVSMSDDIPFSVVVDSGSLHEEMRKLKGPIAAVIIDPIDAHLGGGVDTHRKSEVQRALMQMATLTQIHRCAAIGVAHLSKGDSADLMTRVVGSVGFTTAVRSVIGIGEHPDAPRDRVAVLAKANMTDRSSVPAVRFRVEGRSIPHPDGGLIDTAGVTWLGEEDGIDPDSVTNQPGQGERERRSEAVEWLNSVLGAGPTKVSDIERMAREDGISMRTIHRARADVGVEVTRDENARGRPSTWALRVSCHPYSPGGGMKSNDYVPTPPEEVF